MDGYTTLRVKRLSPDARLPTRADDGAAGYDIAALHHFILPPSESVLVQTGLAVTVPPGTYGRLASRSGLATRHGVDVAAGVVDASYTGHVQVLLRNHGCTTYEGYPGERIAQLVLEMIRTPVVEEVQDLATTERGGGGFGSSGSL